MNAIEPDYISQLTAEERMEVNRALGFALVYGTGIIVNTYDGPHVFTCDPEVAKWIKKAG